MAREKKNETGVLNRCCTVWALPILQLVFDGWRTCNGTDKKLEVLGKYILKCVELKPSHVFAAWKKWAVAERLWRAGEERNGLAKSSTDLKKELEAALARVVQKTVAVGKARKVNTKAQADLDAALKILNSPPHNPSTLSKTIRTFSRAMTTFKHLSEECNADNVADVLDLKPHTVRLGPVYKWSEDCEKPAFLEHPKYSETYSETLLRGEGSSEGGDGKGDYTAGSKEEEIERWAPGRLKGAEEFTHAFRPGETAGGKVILKWIGSLVKGIHSRQGVAPDRKLLEVLAGGAGEGTGEGGVDVKGGEGAELLKLVWQECANLHPDLNEEETLKAKEDFGGRGKNKPSSESMEDDAYLNFHAEKPHVNDARAFLHVVRKSHGRKLGLTHRFRYVNQQIITQDTEPESKKKRLIREAHLGEARKRLVDSGIVVSVFSKYMGRRVPVIDSEVQKR